MRDFPPLVLLVLIRMARLGNQTGQVFASQETIAAACNCSVRSVRRAMNVLRVSGYITRIPKTKRKTDLYVLNYDRWVVWGGQTVSRNRNSGPVKTGQPVRQNQDLNPILNQRPTSSSNGSAIRESVGEALSSLGDALAKRELKEGGHD